MTAGLPIRDWSSVASQMFIFRLAIICLLGCNCAAQQTSPPPPLPICDRTQCQAGAIVSVPLSRALQCGCLRLANSSQCPSNFTETGISPFCSNLSPGQLCRGGDGECDTNSAADNCAIQGITGFDIYYRVPCLIGVPRQKHTVFIQSKNFRGW